MNKKGFSLIELISVIVIIALIAALAVVGVTTYMKKSNDEYNKSLETQIILAAKDYYSEKRSELPSSFDNSSQLDIDVLLAENYLSSEVVDTDGNSCKGSYVTTIITDNGNYENYVCLICNGEILSDESYCSPSAYSDKEKPTCSVTATVGNNPYTGSPTKENVLLTISTSDNNEISKVLLNGTKVTKKEDNSNEFIYTVSYATNKDFVFEVYDKSLNKNTCKSNTINIERTKPSCSLSTTTSTLNELGTANLTITLGDSSGIKSYSLSNNTTVLKSWTSYTTPLTTTVNATGLYKVVVTDNAGNVNDNCSLTILNLCSVNCGKPSCTITVGSGTTSKTLTITSSDTDLTYSWNNSTWSATNTKTVTSNTTYTAYIKDADNNTNSCSATVTGISSGSSGGGGGSTSCRWVCPGTGCGSNCECKYTC